GALCFWAPRVSPPEAKPEKGPSPTATDRRMSVAWSWATAGTAPARASATTSARVFTVNLTYLAGYVCCGSRNDLVVFHEYASRCQAKPATRAADRASAAGCFPIHGPPFRLRHL